jgi:hypothetical protein
MTADSAQFAGRAAESDDLALVHATQNVDVSAFEQLVGRGTGAQDVKVKNLPYLRSLYV